MVQLRTECMFQYDNKFMTHYNSVVYLKYFTVIRKPSFPPRIKYGVNSSGNPASKIRFPRIKYGAGLVKPGMTPIVKSLLRHYTISCVIANTRRVPACTPKSVSGRRRGNLKSSLAPLGKGLRFIRNDIFQYLFCERRYRLTDSSG